MVQKLMVEKSSVKKFMIKKSGVQSPGLKHGVEKSGVEMSFNQLEAYQQLSKNFLFLGIFIFMSSLHLLLEKSRFLEFREVKKISGLNVFSWKK